MSLKKLLAGLASTALLGGGLAVAATATASAEVLMNIGVSSSYVEVGDTLQVTVSPECEADGGTAVLLIEGEDAGDFENGEFDFEVPEEAEGGLFTVQAVCLQDDEVVGASNEEDITVFGAAYVVTDPSPFVTGESVIVTAGDFRPGNTVDLMVFDDGEVVFEATLGTAAADFSVSGTVVFPTELEVGRQYPVELSDGEYTIETFLTVGDVPTPTEAPTETPTETPTDSPSETPDDGDSSVTPSPTPTATSTTPGGPPGLPGTGI